MEQETGIVEDVSFDEGISQLGVFDSEVLIQSNGGILSPLLKP